MANHIKGFELKRDRMKRAESKSIPTERDYICSHFFYNGDRRAIVVEYTCAIELRLYDDPDYTRQTGWNDPINKEVDAISPATIFHVMSILEYHGFEFQYTRCYD